MRQAIRYSSSLVADNAPGVRGKTGFISRRDDTKTVGWDGMGWGWQGNAVVRLLQYWTGPWVEDKYCRRDSPQTQGGVSWVWWERGPRPIQAIFQSPINHGDSTTRPSVLVKSPLLQATNPDILATSTSLLSRQGPFCPTPFSKAWSKEAR
jgi:hypothetical protein